MRTRILLVGSFLALGCGSSQRQVSGSLDTSAFPLNSVAVAQSAQNRIYASPASGSGSFMLSVPTGQRYRLMVAQPQAGGYAILAHVRWKTATGNHPWAKLLAGAPISLGRVGRAAKQAAPSASSGSESDDAEHESEGEGSDGNGQVCSGSGQGSVDDAEGSDTEDDGSIEADDGHGDDGEGDDGETSLTCGGADGGSSGSGGPACGASGATCQTATDCCTGLACTGGSCVISVQ